MNPKRLLALAVLLLFAACGSPTAPSLEVGEALNSRSNGVRQVVPPVPAIGEGETVTTTGGGVDEEEGEEGENGRGSGYIGSPG